MTEYSYLFPLVLNIAKYFVLAGIPFLIFYIVFPNTFTKNKIQPRNAKRKDFIREILHSMQATFVFVGLVLLILKTPLRDYTQFYMSSTDYSMWWIPVSVLLALIIHDTYFYWMHKTVHHPTLFKRVHLVHHKSVNPSPWASFSFHFFESLLEAMVAPIILLFIPMNIAALIIFGFVSFAFNVYGHLGYEIAPKWFRHSFLFQLMVTSTHHNIHHAKFKGNYGLYFRIWDRIMETEHPDYVKEYDEIQERRFGRDMQSPKSLSSSVIVVAFFLLGFVTMSATSSQSEIEGKWKFRDNGAVVLIYEENGLYYGKLIEAGNEEDNQKLNETGEVIIIRGFEKESQNTYCCGTVFAPKHNKTLQATMTLENSNKLKIDAKYGIFKGSRILDKV